MESEKQVIEVNGVKLEVDLRRKNEKTNYSFDVNCFADVLWS